MKTYLAIEHGEYFTFDAEDRADAEDTAPMWGAELLGEVPKEHQDKHPKQMLAHLV